MGGGIPLNFLDNIPYIAWVIFNNTTASLFEKKKKHHLLLSDRLHVRLCVFKCLQGSNY